MNYRIEFRDHLLLSNLDRGKFTANEVIHSIYRNDVKNGIARTDWKFYLHLNKRFAPLSRRGLVAQVETKMGPSKRLEKVWGLTLAGVAYLQNSQVLAA